MTSQELTKYIKYALDLEKAIYIQKKTLYQLDQFYDSLGYSTTFYQITPPGKNAFFDDDDHQLFTFLSALAVGGLFLVGSLLSDLNSCIGMGGGLSLLAKILAVLVIIIWCIVFITDRIGEYRRYSQVNYEYKQNCNYQQQMIVEDYNRVQNELLIKPRVLDQRNLLYNKYLESKALLEKFYSLDIIFPKYRNFVAICTFYEYFTSGRCTSLIGHEGAYNIYENEVRLERIVSKLDIVIERLDEIRDNQYMLHDAITNCNNSINNLTGSVKQLTSSVNYSADQTAIAAQNSRWAANELNTIKWLNILKY